MSGFDRYVRNCGLKVREEIWFLGSDIWYARWDNRRFSEQGKPAEDAQEHNHIIGKVDEEGAIV
jgi:hypothetical protein